MTQAQPYPSKPIRFVIPFGPGSASDALARIAGQELAQTLGQPIVVVPKPGADGALSAGEVKRAAPDGYTFLFGTNSPLAVVPNMRKEPPYNVLTDFTPVTYLGDNTFFIVVHPSVPAKSVAELVAYAKASPKPLNYAAGNTYAFVSTAMFATQQRHPAGGRALQVGARCHDRPAVGPRAAHERHLDLDAWRT